MSDMNAAAGDFLTNLDASRALQPELDAAAAELARLYEELYAVIGRGRVTGAIKPGTAGRLYQLVRAAGSKTREVVALLGAKGILAARSADTMARAALETGGE